MCPEELGPEVLADYSITTCISQSKNVKLSQTIVRLKDKYLFTLLQLLNGLEMYSDFKMCTKLIRTRPLTCGYFSDLCVSDVEKMQYCLEPTSVVCFNTDPLHFVGTVFTVKMCYLFREFTDIFMPKIQ